MNLLIVYKKEIQANSNNFAPSVQDEDLNIV